MKTERCYIPKRIRDRKEIALIADGKTEQWYLAQMRKEENIPITIQPELPTKRTLKEELQKVYQCLEKGYDHVFWIIDLDVVNHSQKEDNNWHFLANSIEEINSSDITKVTIVLNNPCLEFWYILHYKSTSRSYQTFTQLKADLNKYLPNYDKSEKYYVNLYKHLRDRLPQAVQHAKQLPSPQRPYNKESFKVALCDMYKIVEYLHIID